MKNAHVIGLGRSGVAAARLLQRNGWQVVLSDRNPHPPMADHQAQLSAGGYYRLLLDYGFVTRQPHQPGGGQSRRAVGHPGPGQRPRDGFRGHWREWSWPWRFLERPAPGWALPAPTQKPLDHRPSPPQFFRLQASMPRLAAILAMRPVNWP